MKSKCNLCIHQSICDIYAKNKKINMGSIMYSCPLYRGIDEDNE